VGTRVSIQAAIALDNLKTMVGLLLMSFRFLAGLAAARGSAWRWLWLQAFFANAALAYGVVVFVLSVTEQPVDDGRSWSHEL
jgi:hypothetical protein